MESHWLTVVHGDVEALAPAVSQGVRHLCVGVRPQGGVSSRLASARQTDRAKVKRQKNAQIELPASVKTITSDHFEASAESDNARSFLKYRIRRDAYFLSFSDVFQLWEQDTYFVDFYISVFEQSGYYGYIWETPAISTKSLDDTFEFVIHALPKSSGLPDHGTYAGYFDTETAPDGIVSFQNLGGDALLIVPSPYRPTADYSGLAEFFREAPLGQQRRLWCELGRHAKVTPFRQASVVVCFWWWDTMAAPKDRQYSEVLSLRALHNPKIISRLALALSTAPQSLKWRLPAASRVPFISPKWRRRMGIEPTARCWRAADFEDQEGHQTLIASGSPAAWSCNAGRQAPRARTRRSAMRLVKRMASRCSSRGTQ